MNILANYLYRITRKTKYLAFQSNFVNLCQNKSPWFRLIDWLIDWLQWENLTPVAGVKVRMLSNIYGNSEAATNDAITLAIGFVFQYVTVGGKSIKLATLRS